MCVLAVVGEVLESGFNTLVVVMDTGADFELEALGTTSPGGLLFSTEGEDTSFSSFCNRCFDKLINSLFPDLAWIEVYNRALFA